MDIMEKTRQNCFRTKEKKEDDENNKNKEERIMI